MEMEIPVKITKLYLANSSGSRRRRINPPRKIVRSDSATSVSNPTRCVNCNVMLETSSRITTFHIDGKNVEIVKVLTTLFGQRKDPKTGYYDKTKYVMCLQCCFPFKGLYKNVTRLKALHKSEALLADGFFADIISRQNSERLSSVPEEPVSTQEITVNIVGAENKKKNRPTPLACKYCRKIYRRIPDEDQPAHVRACKELSDRRCGICHLYFLQISDVQIHVGDAHAKAPHYLSKKCLPKEFTLASDEEGFSDDSDCEVIEVVTRSPNKKHYASFKERLALRVQRGDVTPVQRGAFTTATTSGTTSTFNSENENGKGAAAAHETVDVDEGVYFEIVDPHDIQMYGQYADIQTDDETVEQESVDVTDENVASEDEVGAESVASEDEVIIEEYVDQENVGMSKRLVDSQNVEWIDDGENSQDEELVDEGEDSQDEDGGDEGEDSQDEEGLDEGEDSQDEDGIDEGEDSQDEEGVDEGENLQDGVMIDEGEDSQNELMIDEDEDSQNELMIDEGEDSQDSQEYSQDEESQDEDSQDESALNSQDDASADSQEEDFDDDMVEYHDYLSGADDSDEGATYRQFDYDTSPPILDRFDIIKARCERNERIADGEEFEEEEAERNVVYNGNSRNGFPKGVNGIYKTSSYSLNNINELMKKGKSGVNGSSKRKSQAKKSTSKKGKLPKSRKKGKAGSGNSKKLKSHKVRVSKRNPVKKEKQAKEKKAKKNRSSNDSDSEFEYNLSRKGNGESLAARDRERRSRKDVKYTFESEEDSDV